MYSFLIQIVKSYVVYFNKICPKIDYLIIKRKKNLIKILVLLFIFSFLFLHNFSLNQKIIIENYKNYKSIELYTEVFDYKNWDQPGLGIIPFEKCPEKRCFAFKSTIIRQKAHEESDGVLVHGPNLWYLPNRKTYRRNPKQLWLYYALESPRGSQCSMHYKQEELDDWFNITSTYKTDSDFIVNYQSFNKWEEINQYGNYLTSYKKKFSSLENAQNSIQDLSMKKNKPTVAWFVSHCETSSRREKFINEMRKYIDIDIYGMCNNYFENTIPDPCKKSTDENCFQKLLNSYKFYLSFENSLCEDYITEKYWKFYKDHIIFDVNLIPVVRGATEEQFKKVAPPNSYINAYNFKSAKSLADYLNYLNSNDTAYFEYFNWKKDLYKTIHSSIESNNTDTSKFKKDNSVVLSSIERSPFCILCSLLHNETYMNSKNNKIWNLSKWFGTKTSCWDEDEERRTAYWFTQFFGYCF
jgi:hypothetical protein